MRYAVCMLALTISLGCAARQPRPTAGHNAAVPAPSPTPTPEPSEAPAGDLSNDTKNEIPVEAKRILDRAERLEVLLVNPVGTGYTPNIGYKLNSRDRYYGYEVSGKAVVSGAKAKELRGALYSGVAAIRKGESAMCFYPRHGLRATYRGRTTALLICFHCMNFYTYTADGQTHPPMNAITRGAQPLFNRVLSEAGVSVR